MTTDNQRTFLPPFLSPLNLHASTTSLVIYTHTHTHTRVHRQSSLYILMALTFLSFRAFYFVLFPLGSQNSNVVHSRAVSSPTGFYLFFPVSPFTN